MGYTLGPMIGSYWSMAPVAVIQSLAGTGLIFFSMSMLAISSKKDFKFLGKSFFVGVLVAFLAGIGAWIFNMPALSLVVSVMFVLLMSGMILYETNTNCVQR